MITRILLHYCSDDIKGHAGIEEPQILAAHNEYACSVGATPACFRIDAVHPMTRFSLAYDDDDPENALLRRG